MRIAPSRLIAGISRNKFTLSHQASWGKVSATTLPKMSRQALYPALFLILSAGCLVKAEAPDAAVVRADSSDVTPDTRICPEPKKASCSENKESSGICDPVCQTGKCDWCNEKCSYGTGAEIYCSPKVELPAKINDECYVTFDEVTGKVRSDNCEPGLVCLSPNQSDDRYYCFQPCRSPDHDCPAGAGKYNCSLRKIPSRRPEKVDESSFVRVCDPSPILTCGEPGVACCNPWKKIASGDGSCPVDHVCRLVGVDPKTKASQTTCDRGLGEGRRSPCTSNRDCLLAFWCMGLDTCEQVCDPADKSSCDGAGTCIVNVEKYGSTYGYCIIPK
jgi:hypothetical protein